MHDGPPPPERRDTNEFAARFAVAVEHVRRRLPDQRPLGEFVHHNTLSAYQGSSFHDALAAASVDHDARIYWAESRFRAALALGDFGERDVLHALGERYRVVPDRTIGPLTRRGIERAILLDDVLSVDVGSVASSEAGDGRRVALYRAVSDLFARSDAPIPHASLPANPTHRDLVVALRGDDPAPRVDAQLVRFLGAFLDDGMSSWSMPDRHDGLLRCFVRFASTSRRLAPPFVARALVRLERAPTPVVAVAGLVDELGIADAELASYLTRTMLELPGFAGMVSVCPGTATPTRTIPRGALAELVAVRLALITEAVRDEARELGHRGPLRDLPAYCRARLPADVAARERELAVVYEICRLAGLSAAEVFRLGVPFVLDVVDVVRGFDATTRGRTFHEAMEHAQLRTTVSALAENRERPAQIESPDPRFQVVFCVDDREEGIRRHFEELDPRHVTFGTAGFFGVAMAFRAIDDSGTRDLCPDVVAADHVVVERASPEHVEAARRGRRMRRFLALARTELSDASRSFIRGLLVTPLLGLLAIVPLVAGLLAPRSSEKFVRGLRRRLVPAFPTEFVVDRDPDAPEPDARAIGFTLEERVDRVATTLENVGLVRTFAPIVCLLGHGATTENDPHHAAFACAACGGRSGGPNARAFAAMANDRSVRAALAARGIVVPESTWFVGGLHDTTTDAVTLFDTEGLEVALGSELASLRRSLDAARARSAHERCRRFEHASLGIGLEQALRHVEERAVDPSQVRPELGHATNSACIVGRRALSRGLFLDRRAFLVSYDPATDPDSAILARILASVTPIGAGVNLHYYFSSVDPDRWGAGAKLSHNPVGLVGVMEGGTGDLRTGLAREMTEVHEPVRLLVIVDASVDAIARVAERAPAVRDLVHRRWVRLVCIDPDSGAIDAYTDRGFEPLGLADVAKLPVVRSAVDWYRGRRESLPPARIAPSSSFVGG